MREEGPLSILVGHQESSWPAFRPMPLSHHLWDPSHNKQGQSTCPGYHVHKTKGRTAESLRRPSFRSSELIVGQHTHLIEFDHSRRGFNWVQRWLFRQHRMGSSWQVRLEHVFDRIRTSKHSANLAQVPDAMSVCILRHEHTPAAAEQYEPSNVVEHDTRPRRRRRFPRLPTKAKAKLKPKPASWSLLCARKNVKHPKPHSQARNTSSYQWLV